MVSPGTLSIEPKKVRRFPHHRLAHQPVDLREGVAKAYSVVKEVSGCPRGWAGAVCVLSWSLSKEHQGLGFVLKEPQGWLWDCFATDECRYVCR